MSNMDHNYWSKMIGVGMLLVFAMAWCAAAANVEDYVQAPLTACQHLRHAETRRAKSLDATTKHRVRIPKCSRAGDFEPIQCSNEINGTACWCVDEYGLELPGTRAEEPTQINCSVVAESGGNTPECPASSCRMYCPAGFARDARTGCPKCQCRDPCEGVLCPGDLSCQLQEVTCIAEPCPPVPTCKKARSLSDLCPAGQPLTIQDTPRPFLCGIEPGKPMCPPMYKCLVQSGNDYGVCCPGAIAFQKPGNCPRVDDVQTSVATGTLCGTPCGADLECPQMEKCCQSKGCGTNCRQPFNVTSCHQARMLSELMSVNEREGRGYVPACDVRTGIFAKRQCSRNGLVCWCVDPHTGHKMRDSMGAASMVDCDRMPSKNAVVGRSQSRSVDSAQKCDQNICASVCEYGFKIDHEGCATCECSEPCEGFQCPMGSHCEVARDLQCSSASALCASEPVCKPDLVYTNPCDEGTPLASNKSGEVFYCRPDEIDSMEFQTQNFFDANNAEVAASRAMTNIIECPAEFRCTKLYSQPESVCCPKPEPIPKQQPEERPQSMCEYLRDFSDRMEGTEAGMVLALATPTCKTDGTYEPRICTKTTMKVTRAQQKKILEQKNVREMRMLLQSQSRRLKRDNIPNSGENLRLTKVASPEASGETDATQTLDVKSLLRYLRQNVQSENKEANYMAEILSRKLLNQVQVQERSAKVIDNRDFASGVQSLERGAGKTPGGSTVSGRQKVVEKQVPKFDMDMVEVEVEECFCVDGFGTEIPKSRGTNVTLESCAELRESLDCLDITCRMGCDYGFILDLTTRCPTCECRDPCDSISCPDGQECRSVEVSCEGEYCPPVPACLPRKPGQCPFLVPPGTEGSTIDSCEYECRSDQHCADSKRCCSNGCGTQCVEPQLKTACQHLQTIQLHQATELGIPPKQKYIAQCNVTDGAWLRVQCGPDQVCWCVDSTGNELSGTRITNGIPECDQALARNSCPLQKCASCEFGYVVNSDGCRTCQCRNPCDEISCPGGEQCQLMRVECIDEPCPRVPVCVPQRESVCSEGLPFKRNGQDLVCGPQGDADMCPSTHTCQLDVESRKGVCCAKTRDVCFESVDNGCLTKNQMDNSTDNLATWRFSPKQNRCVQMLSEKSCQSKNLFHSESACQSVCPVLSQCERLRLRNSLAAKRVQQSTAWFQPRCDPDTGSWSPVQCLGKSTAAAASSTTEPSNGVSRAFSVNEPTNSPTTVGVCWCADKKGAPVKGSLTRGIEPMCNHRQARRRMSIDGDSIHDPMIEQLISQITLIADEDNLIESEFDEPSAPSSNERYFVTSDVVTEKIIEIMSNSIQSNRQSTTELMSSATRCDALKKTASFQVACKEDGSFEPTQCNEAVCWCVDAAGNQLPDSTTFSVGATKCIYTPIDAVSVELHFPNPKQISFKNLYDILRAELQQLLGEIPENLRVHESSDGNIYLKFDLTDENKIDTAFALEEMAKQEALVLARGELVPDITLSRFVHRTSIYPAPQPAVLMPESTFQMIVFVLATSSAFLVSIFVVFVMLKRGKNKMKVYNTNKTVSMGGDKFLDYSSPIFVLSANEKVPNNLTSVQQSSQVSQQ